MKKTLCSIILCLLILAGLCGCGYSAGPAIPPASLPSEVRPAEMLPDRTAPKTENTCRISLADTSVKGLTEVLLPDFADRVLDAGEIRGEHILLHLRGEDPAGPFSELVLIRLGSEPSAHSMRIKGLGPEYYLLTGGRVLERLPDETARIYDSGLAPSEEFGTDPGTYLGCEADGSLWFFDKEQSLVRYSGIEKSLTVPAPGIEFADRFAGLSGGTAYFSLQDEQLNTILGAVDCSDGQFRILDTLQRTPVSFDGMISYYANNRWYLADVASPRRVISFTKAREGEVIWRMDRRNALTTFYEYDEAAEKSRSSIRLYDLQNGGLCGELTGEDLQLADTPDLLDYENGRLLLRGFAGGDGGFEIYVYEPESLTAQTGAEDYRVTDHDCDESELGTIKDRIESRYDVFIGYDDFFLSQYDFDYTLIPAEDTDSLISCLLTLEECLAEYPDGFINELKGSLKKGVRIYLCGDFLANTPEAYADPAACVNTTGEYLHLCIKTEYWYDLRQTLLHEMMHLMEQRITEYAADHGIPYNEEWIRKYNTPEYPYFSTYTAPEDPDEYCEGTVTGRGETWYVDGYARTNELEDRARTLEYTMYDAYAWYFVNNPHLMDKAAYLCGLIREAFPSVAACTEPVMWEHRTGIVPGMH